MNEHTKATLHKRETRLGPVIEIQLQGEQTGFRKTKSCRGAVFILRQTVEEYVEYDKNLFATFVDQEKKTVDRVDRITL